MDGYLFDTSALSPLFDSSHPKHVVVTDFVASLPLEAPKYVSAIALGEIRFGVSLAGNPSALDGLLKRAEAFHPLEITVHTAREYGELKATIASYFLEKLLRRDRPRWLEDWVDKHTGKLLQLDENDLWMCAQALERALVLLTTDAKMKRVLEAANQLRLNVIS